MDAPTQPQPGSRRRLGATGIEVPALGTGTNRWRKGVNDGAVFEVFQALMDGGVSFFDTAEIYGFGSSERLLGECLRKDGRPAFTASKFMPSPGRGNGKGLKAALDKTLSRLGLSQLDLYYVHHPMPFADLDGLAGAMAASVAAGKLKAVGVSNFSADQMRRFAERLDRHGVKLAANQVHYSLIHRQPETNGVLDACRELDVALVAYFPLASGRLAGAAKMEDAVFHVVMKTVQDIAADRGVEPGEVALNWLLAKDERIIPIPGCTKLGHARANLKTLEWSLSEDEFASLDSVSGSAPPPLADD